MFLIFQKWEPNINIAVTSKDLKEALKKDGRNIEIVDKDLNAKRFYHFIVMEKFFDSKKSE